MPERDNSLKLDQQLCFPLYAAARKVVGAYTPLLRPLGLTYTQYLVLLVLWERDGISVGTLGKRLHLDSGTLTPVLKRLQASGLIERRRGADDERVVTVHLTERGTDLKAQARDIPERMQACFDIAPDEARELYTILHHIIDA